MPGSFYLSVNPSNPFPRRWSFSRDQFDKRQDLLLLTPRKLTDLAQHLHDLRLWRW